MDDRVKLFLHQTGPVLCVDIGASCQNAILARPGQICGDWARFTFLAPAQMVAQRIRELTLLKRGVWLHGRQMGNGFVHALVEHLAAGLPAAATPDAASSFMDNPDLEARIEVPISNVCPKGHVPVWTGDFNPVFWDSVLRLANLPLPHMVLAAVQDHGITENAGYENRMRFWQNMILDNPDPEKWIYAMAPPELKRLSALQSATGGPVADTTTCAILGALCDTKVFERSCRQGITIVSAGNTHITAALVYRGLIYGIYEHHTEKRDVDQLLADLRQFRNTWLASEEISLAGGHGSAYAKNCEEAGGFEPIFVLGPKRELLEGCASFISPHGDTLHAGCFGLLMGWSRLHAKV